MSCSYLFQLMSLPILAVYSKEVLRVSVITRSYISSCILASRWKYSMGLSVRFFSNHGAVAGVFVVVGIIVASMFACCGLFLWRRRNRQKRERLRAGMAWPQHVTGGSQPPMGVIHWGSRAHSPRSDIQSDLPLSAQPLAGNLQQQQQQPSSAIPMTSTSWQYRGPFHDSYYDTHPTGVPHDGEYKQDSNKASRRVSLAPSTPSIYPAALPRDGDSFYGSSEDNNDDQPDSPQYPTPPGRHASKSPPAMARRKMLIQPYDPMTPPVSDSETQASSNTLAASTGRPLTMESILDEDVNDPAFKTHLKRLMSMSQAGRNVSTD
jgi:hypothetical protein